MGDVGIWATLSGLAQNPFWGKSMNERICGNEVVIFPISFILKLLFAWEQLRWEVIMREVVPRVGETQQTEKHNSPASLLCKASSPLISFSSLLPCAFVVYHIRIHSRYPYSAWVSVEASTQSIYRYARNPSLDLGLAQI